MMLCLYYEQLYGYKDMSKTFGDKRFIYNKITVVNTF